MAAATVVSSKISPQLAMPLLVVRMMLQPAAVDPEGLRLGLGVNAYLPSARSDAVAEEGEETRGVVGGAGEGETVHDG
jgi:hypothetical protein